MSGRPGQRPGHSRYDILLPDILRLYRDHLQTEVADELGIPSVTVWRLLRRHGVVTRPRGTRGVRCRYGACGKATYGGHYCRYHRKIRRAEMNRMVVRRRKGIPKERWRA